MNCIRVILHVLPTFNKGGFESARTSRNGYRLSSSREFHFVYLRQYYQYFTMHATVLNYNDIVCQ